MSLEFKQSYRLFGSISRPSTALSSYRSRRISIGSPMGRHRDMCGPSLATLARLSASREKLAENLACDKHVNYFSFERRLIHEVAKV